MNKRMTMALILGVLQHAHILRKPPRELLHRSDRGSQYTSKAYRNQLPAYGMRSSMSGEGNGYNNAVVERFLAA